MPLALRPTTYRLQTRYLGLPTIDAMDQKQNQQKDTDNMESNIKHFIAAARNYLFSLPTPLSTGQAAAGH